MDTAVEFAAESARRWKEGQDTKDSRRQQYLEQAREYWGEIAQRIKDKAIWHLKESEVSKDAIRGILKPVGIEDWMDLEWVVRQLGQENGFEVKDQWEVIPKGYIFDWSEKKEEKPKGEKCSHCGGTGFEPVRDKKWLFDELQGIIQGEPCKCWDYVEMAIDKSNLPDTEKAELKQLMQDSCGSKNDVEVTCVLLERLEEEIDSAG